MGEEIRLRILPVSDSNPQVSQRLRLLDVRKGCAVGRSPAKEGPMCGKSKTSRTSEGEAAEEMSCWFCDTSP